MTPVRTSWTLDWTAWPVRPTRQQIAKRNLARALSVAADRRTWREDREAHLAALAAPLSDDQGLSGAGLPEGL